jgi:hypothetical protein
MTRIRLLVAMAVDIGGAMIEFGSWFVQRWSWLSRQVVLEINLLGTDGRTGVDEVDWMGSR